MPIIIDCVQFRGPCDVDELFSQKLYAHILHDCELSDSDTFQLLCVSTVTRERKLPYNG